MARNSRHRKARERYLILGDGETEKLYFTALKRAKNEALKNVNIEPKLSIRKPLKNQYENVLQQAKDYDKVYWIVDLDIILEETKAQTGGGASKIQEFIRYRRELNNLDNVLVIVNQPCLEYWLLLHFQNTTRPFNNCSQAAAMLKEHLPNYEKTEKYYLGTSTNIFKQLEPRLNDALSRSDAIGAFDEYDNSRSISEMYLLFEDLGLKPID